MAAKDVQQRPLDLSSPGATGSPTAPTDATHVDPATLPQPDGAGAPGNSLLAAPANHVHPGATASNYLQADVFTNDAVNWSTLVTVNINTSGGTTLAAQAHASVSNLGNP